MENWKNYLAEASISNRIGLLSNYLKNPDTQNKIAKNLISVGEHGIKKGIKKQSIDVSKVFQGLDIPTEFENLSLNAKFNFKDITKPSKGGIISLDLPTEYGTFNLQVPTDDREGDSYSLNFTTSF
jgi:hypothetical protein